MSDQKIFDDLRLIQLLKESNYKAFEAIYDRYWPKLFRMAFKFLKDQDEAKDITQDVFVALWTKSQDIVISKSLSSYLYAMLRNKLLNNIEKSKVRNEYLSSLEDYINAGELSTEMALREKELKNIIENGINKLPPKMRKVFELSRFFDYSYKQISSELNISENTVKKQMNNALNTLRTIKGFILLCILFAGIHFANPLNRLSPILRTVPEVVVSEN
ncbi:RNA polymerase sigma factor [Olivibacter sitiensis]|uniref:RNA polymerase sigma factor n=1 Tax=Olivibacter sitiensis TaxID=376470 RepID=UPI0003FD8994|nr:RNA polymerase sigma-70 factor [Olivibacter sitiensis]